MIPVHEALDIVLSNSDVLSYIEVSLDDAIGCIAYEDIKSMEPLPPFEASMKDGYAVFSSDGPGIYPVIETITAGCMPTKEVTSGTISRITTGSPIPKGADAVIMV
jgi:gephyrin